MLRASRYAVQHKDRSMFLLEYYFSEVHLSHDSGSGTREPGPSWQGWQESAERWHNCAQSARVEKQLGRPVLSAGPSPHPSLVVYTCSALLMSVASLAIAESMSLFPPPPLRLSLLHPSIGASANKAGEGVPELSGPPDQPLECCSANVHSLPTSLGVYSLPH